MDALWLVWNNILYVLLTPWMMYVASYRVDLVAADWAWELETPCLLFCVQIYRHMCSVQDSCVGSLSVETFEVFEMWCSLMLLSAVISVQMGEISRKRWRPLTALLSLNLCLVFAANNQETISLAIVFIVCLLTYCKHKIAAVILNPAKHFSAILGFILYGTAIFCKQDLGYYTETDERFVEFHGLWHIFSALGAAALIWDARNAPSYFF